MQHEPRHPFHVRLLGAAAVVPHADRVAHLPKEARLPRPAWGPEKQVVDRARNPPVFANQQATGYPYSSANALISRKIDSAGTRNAE
jgi:hypothetical protein